MGGRSTILDTFPGKGDAADPGEVRLSFPLFKAQGHEFWCQKVPFTELSFWGKLGAGAGSAKVTPTCCSPGGWLWVSHTLGFSRVLRIRHAPANSGDGAPASRGKDVCPGETRQILLQLDTEHDAVFEGPGKTEPGHAPCGGGLAGFSQSLE